MSELGETADKILELLGEVGKITVNELEEKVPITDNILNFMNLGGFIELKKGEVKITEFGRELIAVG